MLTKEQSDMAERCTPFYGEHSADDYEGYSGLVRYWWVAEYLVDLSEIHFDTYTRIYPATTVKEAKAKADNLIKYPQREIPQRVNRVRPATVEEMLVYLSGIQSYLNIPEDDLPF